MKRGLLAACFAAAMMFPAHALDFTAPLTDSDGATLTYCVAQKPTGECERTEPLTLSRALRNALYASYPDEQNLSGDEKYRRAELAGKLNTKDVTLKAEDVALLKKLVAKLYGPLVVYEAWSRLDPPK